MTMPHEYLRAIRGAVPLLEAVVANPAHSMDLRAWAATALEKYPTAAELDAELDDNRLDAGADRVNEWGDALMYTRWLLDALLKRRLPAARKQQVVWVERHFPMAMHLPRRPLIEEPDRLWRPSFMGWR